MNQACWKFDEESKAHFVDLDDDNDAENDSKEYGHWDRIPDILLGEIFSYLTINERYYASLVCRSWYRAFQLQQVWSTFTLDDNTLTRKKFNYYSGYQHVLDHLRASTCLNKVGRNFRTLVFEPMQNFYNLYEFMNMVSWYTERQGSDNTTVAGVGTHIHRLKFTFPCNLTDREDPYDRESLIGTGGKLLEALRRLMRNFENLRCLELVDLMLDNDEAADLMDNICDNSCGQTLSKLVLINTTRLYYPLAQVGLLLNLSVLVIGPHNIDEYVLELISYTKLDHLHILLNQYSPNACSVKLPKSSSWIKLRRNNPFLKIHFEVESHEQADAMLPIDQLEYSDVPWHSIVMDNPSTQPGISTVISHGTFFCSTIRVYAFKGITTYYLDKSSSKTLNRALVQFCTMCPYLHTLMIRDEVLTATILEIVSMAKMLRYLYVRRNAVLEMYDEEWLNITNWSAEHSDWIKMNSQSCEKTEKEVSKIFGYRWHMLSEKEFENQSINLHI